MKTKSIICLTAVVLLFGNCVMAQDTIIKRNNGMIFSKIEEISPSFIKYHRLDDLQGPVYSIDKSEVKSIHYKNGYRDDFASGESKDENVSTVEKKEAADTSGRYILTMNDGSRLKGKIISQNAKSVTFLDNNLGQKTIARTKIAKLELEFGEDIKVITLTDGTILSGKIINQTDNYTILKTQDLGNITLAASKIKAVRDFDQGTISKMGNIRFKNPNSTRYLFAPSAFQLKKGEGYYQNIYGLFNAVNCGITNHITIGGGLTGPFGAYLDGKAGTEVIKNINVAAGVIMGNSFFEINKHNLGLALGFGAVTVGNYDHNITVEAGYGYIDNAASSGLMSHPVLSVNAMTRLGKRFALVTENWFVSSTKDVFAENDGNQPDDTYHAFYSYGFRFMNEKTTLDAGFINTPTLFERGWKIGIPFIGFAIRFGKYKEEL